MARPGPRNLITDVDGILVGNAIEPAMRTGVTAVLPTAPTLAGVDFAARPAPAKSTGWTRPASSTASTR